MTHNRAPFRIAQSVLLVIGIAVSARVTFGQAAAARPDRGITPSGSYAISDIEKINLENGNLGLSIPLASLPPIAGGKVGFTLSAEYNSKVWDAVRKELLQDPLDQGSKYTTTEIQAGNGGWIIGGAYSIAFVDADADYDWRDPVGNDPEYNLITQNRWIKVVLTTPDGATHELRPLDKSPYVDGYLNHPYLRGFYKDSPNTTGTALRYYSFDGSHLWVKINPNPFFQECNCRPYGEAASWTIYLPDGTQIVQGDGIRRVIDNNGNKVKIFTTESSGIHTTHYQDELTEREIKYVYDPAGNSGLGQGQVQYQTVGGTWMTVYVNFGSTHVHGKVYAFGDPDCSEGSHELGQTISVVRSIVFPQTETSINPRQFSFAYNSDTSDTVSQSWYPSPCNGAQTMTSTSHGLGSLSQMIMPSGAVVNYHYEFDGQVVFMDPNDLPRESVGSKELVHDGTSETWTYSNGPGGGGFTAPDGSSVNETMYPYDRAFAHYYAGFGGKEGLVYRIDQSNKVRVEKHWTLKNFGGVDAMVPGNNVLAAFNPMVDAEYTTLLDDTSSHNPIKMSAKTYTYDYNGNLTSETDYDWFDPALVSRDAQGIPTGVPGSATVLRSVSNEYYNDSTSQTSTNVYARQSLSASSPLIQNALKSIVTGASEVRLSYDGNSYGTAPSVGNLTVKAVKLDANSWITTNMAYGTYGNLASTTDGRGHTTSFYYDYSPYAAPNRVVVNPDNGTGAQTTTTVYDYYTGLVTSQTDANGQTSNIYYTNSLLGAVDPFGRPGLVEGPLLDVNGVNQHHRTMTLYEDHLQRVTVASDLNAQDDRLLKSRTTSDMLGRPVLTEQTEDGTNYTIFARKAYDDINRITYSSAPLRSSAAVTDSWTRVKNDVLGRPIEVATFGGAAQPSASPSNNISGWTGSVTTAYDANFTTVTDQAGKVRRSMVNGLGQLVRVDEPDKDSDQLDSNGTPTQPTCYEYDVLGNLTKVIQGTLLDPYTGRCTISGSQQRAFTYDTLSRLRSAENPESGTITYAYDENGNLTSKTDARSITATYVYDSLNRMTSRGYSDGTPTATYAYDTATNGKGRLASVSSSVSSYAYSGYDAMGRVLGATQTIGSQSYSITDVTYDLAGHLTSMKYPSGHTVTNAFDNAGRLVSFSGKLGDNTTRSYATGISYSPSGSLTQEQYGTTTAIFNKLSYNSRGQLTEIRAGTAGVDDNRGRIVNDYSGTDNNGNLRKQTVSIPNNDQNTIPTSSYQQYEYDSLNRLERVHEHASNNDQLWQQKFVYDRYGNRRIDIDNTSPNIPRLDFEVEATTNRLLAPGDSALTGSNLNQRKMRYDNAGNLVNDNWSSYGSASPGVATRTYDAENRMTSAQDSAGGITNYTYDADGRRVRRSISGQPEVWQVYGIGGELLAEYAANASPTTPQEEYGYRNGQLLITAKVTAGGWGPPPSFTPPATLVSGVEIKLEHLTELRDAVNELRRHAGLSPATWTVDPDPQRNVTTIKADHIRQLRAELEDARSHLHLSTGGYAHPTLTENISSIYAIDFQELRDQVLAAWNNSTGGVDLRWLVSDQLGTPRMIFDQSGSLASMTRHDYLPFGEELFGGPPNQPGVGGRTTTQGYSGDSTRQKFTSKERDSETGLDYSVHRYYSSTQGRFSSVDPTLQSINGLNPQSLNRYSYVLNDPLNFIDPFGLWELSYTEIWEGGKYVRTHVTITKTKEKDDANSLLKQLGYDPKSKEGQQLLNEIGAQLKQGEEVDPTKLGGIVGREYSTYEDKYSNQVQYNLAHPYKPGTQVSGPRDPDYADCSMTACRIAFPNQMRGYGLMGQPFDVGKASDMLAQTPSPKDGLRTGDIIRYGREDKTHFVNVLFTDDNGTTQAFSRTGVKGPFESLRVNDPNITQSYGKITGQYRPPF